uniref:Prefoldin subunit 5 n=1 Tax=Syphacia muris TaxID=451379 RepID=A0A0N5ABB0_9BILA
MMGSSEEPIPISELSIEQMLMLQRQIEQEISFFSESLKELKACHAKFAASEAAVNSVDVKKPNKEALIPLSESMYVKAHLIDPTKVLVEIGTGYYVEMKNEQAKDYLKRKQDYLRKQVYD